MFNKVKSKEGARQGDPLSLIYLYFVYKYFFTTVKNNEDMKSLNIPGHTTLYAGYADGTTFFLKKLSSIKELPNTIPLFSSLSGLKPNLSKCDVAGIGLLKRVKVTVCKIKCTDSTKDAIKTLGIFFRITKILN